ncbi:hypothetical protein H2198_009953 [Neophaeococcomyces mojaviensis]|uniref:Uncharacterized protein n=1 Tax=Neophaeococcomyces mojaviensis TaxID=3383035 RepID=A0ACC2ZT57_9EURO|nr:hypothetical protein H2198_009953 [Knufia sp. JES_112]
MAYNKTFNPDALPAHAEPEQAAQALSQLQVRPQSQQQKPQPRPHYQQQHPPPRQPSPGDRRPSPAVYAAQQSYRPQPSNLQTNHTYNNNNHYQSIQSPPPPAEYGQGPRPRPPPQQYQQQHTPQQQYANRPHQQSFPPPDADSADLYPLFRAANASQTGSLTTSELGSALVNADFTPFDPLTIRSLMRMFSTTPPSAPSGPSLSFPEFQNLWRFLAAWRQLFERFDEDQSGKISLPEFSNALVAFGYRLSQPFTGLLYSTFNDRGNARRGSRQDAAGGGMSFDLFVQACIRLKRMTDVFKNYDEDRDGYVTLSFEEFLSEILRLQEP